MPNFTKRCRIIHESGLNSEFAKKMVDLVNIFESDVYLTYKGKEFIILRASDIALLKISLGDEVNITAKTGKNVPAMVAISSLIGKELAVYIQPKN